MTTEVTFVYTNHRGENSTRRVIPQKIWFGSTPWHEEPCWLLNAHDQDKGAERDFDLRFVSDWRPARS